MNRAALLLITAHFFLGGCRTTTPTKHTHRNPREIPPQTNAQIEREVIDRVNGYRRSRRLATLRPDRSLSAAAREHAQWMARRENMSHSGFDRRFRQLKGAGFRGVGENVAMSFGIAQPAAFAFNGWRGSPDHHKNMVADDFLLTGVGVARSGDGSVYIAHLFGYR